MRIVLDTSALFYPKALESLAAIQQVVLPAVAFLERARQLARQDRMKPLDYRRLIEKQGWGIEPFGADEAVQSPAHLLNDGSWKKLARDAMIASHVQKDDELWTANPKDFIKVGVPSRQIVDVAAMDF